MQPVTWVTVVAKARVRVMVRVRTWSFIVSRSMFLTGCYEQSIGHVKAPVYWTASTFQSIQLLFFNQITSNRSIANVSE